VETISYLEETEIVVLDSKFFDVQILPTIVAPLPESPKQLLGLKMKVTLQHNSWFHQIMLVILLTK
jgi:hypothetical protein